ncbi:MAG: choice-of-anchor L domain-containing protein, partial [Flavisolibacter sp.]|nr:choice-of-anchor L domain-containing protein [Flavisolibacter sp.]
MFISKRTSLLGIFLFLCVAGIAQLQVTPNTVAQQLAQKLVGQGITISNATLSGSPLSSGMFNHLGGSQLNLDSGIVLSTGRVLTSGTSIGVSGPATSFASSALGFPGDAQLSAQVNNLTTNDAVILEFDFIPTGDTISFRYVFSSDEYPTFACTNFNDVFAFFISGPGITGAKNIALVPGTNIPVAINSVNNNTSNDPQCTGMGPGSPFIQFYVNNTGNAVFAHNGHTVVFTAFSAVTPCQTYHLKIAIADVGDQSYDSGVFLEAGSLSSPPLQIVDNNLPIQNNSPFITEGCQSGSITIARAKKLSTPQEVNLSFGGTAINGVDVNLIPSVVTIPANDSIIVVPIVAIADGITEGIEQLKVYVSLGGCTSANYSDSVTINIYDQVTATAVTQNANCTGTTGQIAITVPQFSGVGPYTYSLNGGAFQTSNVFGNLSNGNY